MLSDEEKIGLLKIEGKRLVQIYESVDIKEAIFEDCPVCAEANRLMIDPNIGSRCGICKQLSVGDRCKRFLHLKGGFDGLVCLFNPEYLRNEEADSRKKIKELIFEVKDELDKVLNEES